MIRIQNIYYMLAYAFKVLQEEGYRAFATENFEHAEDLLSAILAKGIANQIKRGLGREYVHHIETCSSPRGRINISASIKSQTLRKRQLVCEFDEFSENAYVNRILKTTSLLLLRSENVKQEQKKALKKAMLYFHDVDAINIREIKWNAIKYHSNNSTYKMLINICYLVIETLLPNMQDESIKMSSFSDEQLPRLFEKFVLEYYRKHYSKPGFNVSPSGINWNTDDGVVELLPTMKTDITIEHKGKTLIIDTKYYNRTLQSNSLYNSRSIHSNNLYQIFAYVKNKDISNSGNVSGVLLYAKTDEKITPDNSYLMSGNKISVRTLDLDKDFEGIKNQLDRIIDEW